MSSNTAKYSIPYPVAADAVTTLPTIDANQAARLDLLLGEQGAFSNTGAISASTTYSQVVSFARSYATAPPTNPFVIVNLVGQLAATGSWAYWITSMTNTGFTFNCQFTAAQAIGRQFVFRYFPFG